ncbi:hypothetical protein Tco_0883925 [Tanacetum coccineum]
MGITTTSPTPPWCGCGGYGGHSRLGRRHSGGVKRLSTARHPQGVALPQPDTTWCGCGGCTVVFRRLWWLIRHPQPATVAVAAGKVAAVVVLPAVVRRRGGGEGGKGDCEGGAVGEVRLPEKYHRKRWRLA